MSQALAEQTNTMPANVEQHPATSNSAALMLMAERVASNPDANVDKLKQILDIARDARREEAELAFNVAMKEAQQKMRPISADADNPQTRSKYASYTKLDQALRPIYTEHGFSLSFDEGDTDKPDHIRVLCYVSHDGGHTRTYRKDMPADGKGAKGGDVMTKTHATGAADTYGMRYLLKKIFNVAVGEDDKDGNTPSVVITAQQVAEIETLLKDAGATIEDFCSYAGIDALSDLPAAKFDVAKQRILNRKKGAANA